MDGEVALVDDASCPNQLDQLLLGDNPVATLDQYEQKIEGATPNGGLMAIAEQRASIGDQAIAPEQKNPCRANHGGPFAKFWKY